MVTLNQVDLPLHELVLSSTDFLSGNEVAHLDDGKLLPTLKRKPKRTLAETILFSFKKYSKRPCIGVYSEQLRAESGSGYGQEYRWLTYEAIGLRANQLATGIRKTLRNLNNSNKLVEQSPVGILGPNCVSWVLCDLASVLGRIISVPVPMAVGIETTAHILKESKVSILFCCHTQLQKIVAAASLCELKDLKLIAVFSNNETVLAETKIRVSSFKITSITEILNYGKTEVNRNESLNFKRHGNKDIHTVFYTSGSTGMPKGVTLTAENWNNDLANYPTKDSLVALSYMPLSHITDRHHLYVTLYNGGRTGMITDATYLFRRIQSIRPTIMFGAPEIYNTILNCFEDRYGAFSGIDAKFENKKLKSFTKEFLNEFLGGRIKTFVSGGAALSPAVKEFLQYGFGKQMIEGYGSTETGNIALGGELCKGVQVKIEDIPEQRYFKTDKPYPRGECFVRTLRMFAGYYNNPKQTAEAFTEDGWYRTGDIIEVIDHDHIRVIGRRAATIKLSIAEFVNPGALENIYLGSKVVSQIFIHGSNFRSFIVAVVVPNKEYLVEWGIENNVFDNHLYRDFKSLNEHQQANLEYEQAYRTFCKSQRTRNHIVDMLKQLADKKGLESFEMIRKVYIEEEPFSEKNKKLTPSLKLSRPTLRRVYSQHLNQMLRLIDDDQDEKSSILNKFDTFNKMVAIIQETMDLHETFQISKSASLVDLGANSLSAMRISELVSTQFSCEIDNVSLLDPKVTVGVLVQQIDTEIATRQKLVAIFEEILDIEVVRSDITKRPLVEYGLNSLSTQRIHNWLVEAFAGIDLSPVELLSGEKTIASLARTVMHNLGGEQHPRNYMSSKREILVTADCKLESDILAIPERTIMVPADTKTHDVFLTGCTGFIGPFLMQSLIKNLPKTATIHCLIRCKTGTESDAKARLEDTLKKYSIFFSQGERERIRIVVGNLEKPKLGMSESQWRESCRQCSEIYHLGAKVSMVSRYEALRAANVKGTVEVLRMSCTLQNKTVHFFSSTDILSNKSSVFARREGFPLWENDIDPMDVTRGYPLSKFVSENLLAQASERGIKVIIYRVGMTGGSSETGATNKDDFVGRMLVGLPRLGIKPIDTATYVNLLPVNSLCDAIIKISNENAESGSGGIAYHLVNPHGACTFSSLISGVENYLGRSLVEVTYKQWLQALKNDVENPLNAVWKFPTTKNIMDDESFPTFGVADIRLSNVAAILGKTNEWCPAIDSDYFLKCLQFLSGTIKQT